MLATYGAVSSEFDDLEAGSWLIAAYILAQCVAQPLYGKMVGPFHTIMNVMSCVSC